MPNKTFNIDEFVEVERESIQRGLETVAAARAKRALQKARENGTLSKQEKKPEKQPVLIPLHK